MWLFLGFVAILGLASPAWAQASWKYKAEAQKLVNEGLKHDKAEAWQEAREAFEAAIALNDTPKARYYLAKALVNLRLLIEAREHAQAAADNPRAGWWDRKNSRELLKKIEDSIAHITLRVPPDFQGKVYLGDVPLSSSDFGSRLEVNPGTIRILAESAGFFPFEKNMNLRDGADETITVELEPEPVDTVTQKEEEATLSTEGSSQKTWGYVSLAVGGVGLVAGTAFGLMAKNTRNDLEAACIDDVCSENQRDAYDRGKMQAHISTAGFIVGGVGLGLGAVLLLTGPKEAEKEAETARWQPYVGPTGAGIVGTF